VGQWAHVAEETLTKLALFSGERYLAEGQVIFMEGGEPEYGERLLSRRA
jgi:hypothetical protein